MKYVKEVYLDHNLMIELKGAIIEWKNTLTVLSLINNKNLKQLPDVICLCANLSVIHLQSCEDFNKLPEEIGRL